MIRSEARVATSSAERYAKQLCAHANHMGANATWASPEGVVEFPEGGTCRLSTNAEELLLSAEAPTAEQLATIQSIVRANLKRFGHRQQVDLTWSP